jgi:hypothetical protein
MPFRRAVMWITKNLVAVALVAWFGLFSFVYADDPRPLWAEFNGHVDDYENNAVEHVNIKAVVYQIHNYQEPDEEWWDYYMDDPNIITDSAGNWSLNRPGFSGGSFT